MTNSTWVCEKINELGMQRFLQDMINELKPIANAPYLHLLVQDLEMTLSDYMVRNDEPDEFGRMLETNDDNPGPEPGDEKLAEAEVRETISDILDDHWS